MNDHFYTTDAIERDNAAAASYESEGVACYVFSGQVPNSVPFYRALNGGTHDHYYTTSLPDLHYAMLHLGYHYEGIACYVFDGSQPNTVPLFALYNPTSGDNFYTTRLAEAQAATTNSGYNLMGTACWVFDLPNQNTVPLFRLYEAYDAGLSANLIAVAGDNWSAAEWQFFLNGFAGAGRIYRNYSLRLSSAGTFAVPSAAAGGYAVIDDDGEASHLTGDWNGPPGAADVFCVPVYVGAVAGLSPRGGSCNHDAKGMNGSVVERIDPLDVIVAHELGHYLGLAHLDQPNNLMRPVSDAANVLLNQEQVSTIKRHCYVHRF